MPELILTAEQLAPLSGQAGRIAVKNPAGQLVGWLDPVLTPEEVAELKRRAREGPWFTSGQVRARLQALEAEWERTGGFDQVQLREFLAKLDQADPPRYDVGPPGTTP